jgi:maleate cis-trans isomerase
VTTANAMVDVLRKIGARRIAVVTPYLDAVNERLTAYLQQSGIAVAVLNSFKAATTDELAAITADQVAQLARETMQPGCDALFIACSQLPTKEIVVPLEQELGKPVWSSIRATAAQVQELKKSI